MTKTMILLMFRGIPNDIASMSDRGSDAESVQPDMWIPGIHVKKYPGK